MQRAEIREIISDITESAQGGFVPVHDVQDTGKLDALVTSMREHGWTGAPIVVDGEQALTGAHRYWAAEELTKDGIFLDIPRVDVRDLCAAFGADWAAHRAESCTEYDAWRDLEDILPADVAAFLGLDLH